VGRAVIAAFDLDGTLTRSDCVVPFLLAAAGRRPVAMSLSRRAPLAAAAKRDRRKRDDLKAAVVRDVLTGFDAAQLAEVGRSFAAAAEGERLRPDVVARLRWHVAEGHEVVVVTASLAPYAVPLGEALGAHRVLATELEVRDGVCTGELAGPNCRADEKVVRLQAAYGDDVALGWAYGDSSDDRPMLALAEHPVRVTRAPVSASASPWATA
jgi:phosphatidylglycerophosphatase C